LVHEKTADHVQAGTDGIELSDYDLIGSRKNRTGLFALEQVDSFDLLYLPPPGKGIDTGPAAILAAEMYCRERRAMLIGETAEEALRGVRELGYASPNMLGYYPRMRERGSDDIARPVGGAIAGLLCKLDRTYGPWQDVDQQGLGLQRQLVPALDVNNEDTRLLGRMGLNVISGGRSGRARLRGSVTMGRGREAHRKSAQLPVRRFCLQVINTIAAAARWAVFESDDLSVGERICAQVRTYFDCLNDLGAFADTIVLVFHPASCDGPISLTLHLSAGGCRVGSTAFVPSIEQRT
jgi:phage tail sheath protein FI